MTAADRVSELEAEEAAASHAEATAQHDAAIIAEKITAEAKPDLTKTMVHIR